MPLKHRLLYSDHLPAHSNPTYLVQARGDEKRCVLLKPLWDLGQAGGIIQARAGPVGLNWCPNSSKGTTRSARQHSWGTAGHAEGISAVAPSLPIP